jgi:hypothetical protein
MAVARSGARSEARPARAVAGSGRSLGRVIAECDPRGGRLVAGPAGVLRDERKLLRLKRFCAPRRMPLSGCPPHRGARVLRVLGCDPALRGLPEIGMLEEV